MKLLKLISIIIFTTITLSAQQHKTTVSIGFSGNDMVGQRLYYTIKEKVRKSSTMELVDNSKGVIVMHLLTLDGNKNNPNIVSAYAITWCIAVPDDIFEYYNDSVVGVCGSSRINDVADFIVAQTDHQVESLLKLLDKVKQQ